MGTPVGRSKWELDTPALCVELTAMEKNIARMADVIIRRNGVGWRPHTKGMKVPAIAHMLLDAGAFGVTCAKLGEAEVMAQAGVKDILVANQIVGPDKLARLAGIQHHADVKVLVDSIENARAIGEAARCRGVEVGVLVEVDTGMHRCGLLPGEPTIEFSKRVGDVPGLKYRGLMTWESHAASVTEPTKKRQIVDAALGGMVETAESIRKAGLPVDIISCGGTGTYWVSAAVPGVTEIEAGGGIFNDMHYATDFGLEGHEFAMTVMSTVVSRAAPDRVVTDGGEKTMSTKLGTPKPLGIDNVEQVRFSAEHGRIYLNKPNEELKVGDKVEWIVGYSDFTTFLHDEVYATRDGIVEQVWPVLGRGKLR